MLTRLKCETKVRDKTFGRIYDHVERQVWEQIWVPGRRLVWRRVWLEVYRALRQGPL